MQDYDPNRILNDIALLKLKTPLQFTNRIRQICLPSANYDINDASQALACYASGWGSYGEVPSKIASATLLDDVIISCAPVSVKAGNNTSSFLQSIRLPILREDICRSFFGASQTFDAQQNICAGDLTRYLLTCKVPQPLPH